MNKHTKFELYQVPYSCGILKILEPIEKFSLTCFVVNIKRKLITIFAAARDNL